MKPKIYPVIYTATLAYISDKPAAPRNLQVVESTKDSASLSWDRSPADGGSHHGLRRREEGRGPQQLDRDRAHGPRDPAGDRLQAVGGLRVFFQGSRGERRGAK